MSTLRRARRASAAAGLAVVVLAGQGPLQPAAAQEVYIGQLILVGFNYCPRGFSPADGSVLAISTNTALFALLGTTYGGNGQTTFALPDLRGRVPVHIGQGAGLSPVTLGELAGIEQLTLTAQQLPSHTHTAASVATATTTLQASAATASTPNPAGNVLANTGRENTYASGPAAVALGGTAAETAVAVTTTVQPTGTGQPFDNRQPFLGMLWCIATEGIFPPRN
jgi:microcystin-dependent protein